MAPSSRSGTLRAYGPPFWADRMFWIALVLAISVGALAVFALLLLLAIPRTGAGWAWTVGLGLLATWVGFAVLSIGLNTARGLEKGAARASAARGDRYEEHGRRAGRIVGKGLAVVTGRSATAATSRTSGSTASGPDAPIAPTAADAEAVDGEAAEPTRTRTDLDRGANSLGKMVGRRLAERRARTENDT